MPRGPRLDYPGALHHIVVRGIERRRIFRCARDRSQFLGRLAALISGSGAALYAWALMPNHAHALLRTGRLPISRLAQAWLGSYATSFNRIHRRAGHLFQNRFKSTLVEAQAYLLELVRYIHLNPVRSGLPVTIDSLDNYPWTGHAMLLGQREFPAQDVDFVLSHFGDTAGTARLAYRRFVRDGALQETELDLDGGGLRRSAGGGEILARLRRGRERWAYDERILGGSDFVQDVLRAEMEPRTPPPADPGVTVHALCTRAAAHLGVGTEEVASRSLRRDVLAARAVVAHLAVCHHGLSLTTVARALSLSKQSITRALDRAEATYKTHNCSPRDFLDG